MSRFSNTTAEKRQITALMNQQMGAPSASTARRGNTVTNGGGTTATVGKAQHVLVSYDALDTRGPSTTTRSALNTTSTSGKAPLLTLKSGPLGRIAPTNGTTSRGADCLSTASNDGSFDAAASVAAARREHDLVLTPSALTSPADATAPSMPTTIDNTIGTTAAGLSLVSARSRDCVAVSDGAFPAYLQTACVVTYDASRSRTGILPQPPIPGTQPQPQQQQQQQGQPPLPQPPARGGSPDAAAPPQPMQHQDDVIVVGLGDVTRTSISKGRYADEDDYDKEFAATIRPGTAAAANGNGNGAPEDDGPVERARTVEEKERSLENYADDHRACWVTEVWTAETDGSISVRDPATGRHARRQPRCASFGGSQCHCLLQARDLVFAGYQDGYVRAFEASTKAMVFEKRKHAGAVWALAHWRHNIVFSGSEDFRITMWSVGAQEAPDAELRRRRTAREAGFGFEGGSLVTLHQNSMSMGGGVSNASMALSTAYSAAGGTSPTSATKRLNKQVKHKNAATAAVNKKYGTGIDESLLIEANMPSFIHQLPGHGNRVQVLRVEGDVLYSGGDDGLVRCWDIHSKSEIGSKLAAGKPSAAAPVAQQAAPGFPLSAHPKGVRDIAFCEDVLITAGVGGVALWDRATAACVHRFPFPEVLRVHVNPTNLVLWACASDGVVTLIDLYSFEVIGTLDKFAGANIKAIVRATSAAATRVFLAAPNGGVTVAYLESEASGMPPGYVPINATTLEHAAVLDTLRAELLAGDKAIVEKRRLLWEVRDRDHRAKAAGAAILGRRADDTLRVSYLHCGLAAVAKGRQRLRMRAIATHLEENCAQRLVFSTFLKWYRYRRWARDTRFMNRLTDSIARETQNRLIGRQLTNALAVLQHQQSLAQLKQLAVVMERQMAVATMARKLQQWRRYVTTLRKRRAIMDVLGAAARHQQHQFARTYFRRLLLWRNTCRSERTRQRGAHALLVNIDVHIQRDAFSKWARHAASRRFVLQRAAMSIHRALHADRTLLIRAFASLQTFAATRRTSRLAAEAAALTTEAERMANAVANEPPESVDELDAQVAAAEAEIAALQADIADRKISIEELEAREQHLMALAGEGPETAALYGKRPLPLSASGSKSRADRSGSEASSVGGFGAPPLDLNLLGGQRTAFQQCAADVESIRHLAVNLNTCGDRIADIAKRAADPKPGSAAKASATFARAVQLARSGFQEAFAQPGEAFGDVDAWAVDPAAIAAANRTTIVKALGGVRDAVIAWDHLRQRPNAASPEGFVVGSDELSRNIATIRLALEREVDIASAGSTVATSKAVRRTPSSGPTARAGAPAPAAPAARRTAAASTTPTTSAANSPGSPGARRPATATQSATTSVARTTGPAARGPSAAPSATPRTTTSAARSTSSAASTRPRPTTATAGSTTTTTRAPAAGAATTSAARAPVSTTPRTSTARAPSTASSTTAKRLATTTTTTTQSRPAAGSTASTGGARPRITVAQARAMERSNQIGHNAPPVTIIQPAAAQTAAPPQEAATPQPAAEQPPQQPQQEAAPQPQPQQQQEPAPAATDAAVPPQPKDEKEEPPRSPEHGDVDLQPHPNVTSEGSAILQQ